MATPESHAAEVARFIAAFRGVLFDKNVHRDVIDDATRALLTNPGLGDMVSGNIWRPR